VAEGNSQAWRDILWDLSAFLFPVPCHPPSPWVPPTGIRLWWARKVTYAGAQRDSPIPNKEKVLG